MELVQGPTLAERVRQGPIPLEEALPIARQEIHIRGDIPMNNLPLSGSAIRQDGKILLGMQSMDSWFYTLAVLDPGSGRVTMVPLNYTGDLLLSGWTNDGRILAFGEPIRARIWRFRPVP